MVKRITALLMALSMCLALVAPVAVAVTKPYIDPSDRDGVWDRSHSYVVTKTLRVRSKPSNDGDIIDVLPAGTQVVDLFKRTGSEWLCIERENGDIAYCGKQYTAENNTGCYEDVLIREDTATYYNHKGTHKAGSVKAASVVKVTGSTINYNGTALTPCMVGESWVFIPCAKLCYTDAAIIRKKAKRKADILTAVKKGKKDGTIKKGDTVTVTGSVGKHYQIAKRSKKKLVFRYVPKAAISR